MNSIEIRVGEVYQTVILPLGNWRPTDFNCAGEDVIFHLHLTIPVWKLQRDFHFIILTVFSTASIQSGECMCGTIRGTDFAFSVSTNVINKVDLTHF